MNPQGNWSYTFSETACEGVDLSTVQHLLEVTDSLKNRGEKLTEASLRTANVEHLRNLVAILYKEEKSKLMKELHFSPRCANCGESITPYHRAPPKSDSPDSETRRFKKLSYCASVSRYESIQPL